MSKRAPVVSYTPETAAALYLDRALHRADPFPREHAFCCNIMHPTRGHTAHQCGLYHVAAFTGIPLYQLRPEVARQLRRLPPPTFTVIRRTA